MAGAANVGLYGEAIVLLGGAIVAAPLFKRLGLGTVLGYLAAGIVIGPLLRLITDPDEILAVSELGVVFLLFVIGLELKPRRLWSLRRDIFGLGASQVMLTGIFLTLLTALLTGLGWAAAITIGFGLALSSTAFGLQVLNERGELNRVHGQKSFAILLFQDIAIVPMLAILPLFAPYLPDTGVSGFAAVFLALSAILALVLAGNYLINPLFRIIGNTGAREAMIAGALFVVLGSAVLMQVAGLSMAMGAFIAGVLLAESSYRHELEADIEPFRGLLLGLFFMAIGLSLDLGVLWQNWLIIFLAVPFLMAVKGCLIYGLCRIFGNRHDVSLRTALVLPQAGEFGFVLFASAMALGIFDAQTASLLVAIVTLTMAMTPISVALGPYLVKEEAAEQMDEDFHGAGSDVLLIGFSRFGQIVSQILLAGGKEVTIIDHSADRVRSAGKFGFRIYFGDGTRKDVLEAAGIRRAKLIAICTNKRDVTDRIVDMIQSDFPNARLYVRSFDRSHSIELRNKSVDYELRETVESGFAFGRETLRSLGISDDHAHEITSDVRRRDEERLAMQVAEGSIMAGRDMLHTEPVQPEPLTKPRHEATIINEEESAHEEDDDREKAEADGVS